MKKDPIRLQFTIYNLHFTIFLYEEVDVKEYGIEHLRNVVVFGHGGVGKTSLIEAMLFTAGMTNRIGRVDDGTTRSDYSEFEKVRKISLSASLLHCEWHGYKINFIDTPGYADFIGEVRGPVLATDIAVAVVQAVAGVEIGTERCWNYAEEAKLPRIIFVSKMDREYADFVKVCETATEVFGKGVLPLQLPISPGLGFRGVIDLVKMKAMLYGTDGDGKWHEENIPGNLRGEAETYRERLIETAAEADEELLEKYFEEGELTDDELIRGIRTGVLDGTIFPVLCGDASRCIGMNALLDALARYAPSPKERPPLVCTDPVTQKEVDIETHPEAPLVARVFKIISESHVGEMSLLRIYAGTLRSGMDVANATRETTERIGQIYVLNGEERHEIGNVPAGDMAALVKLKDTHTGDTLCDRRRIVVAPPMTFPEPVIRMAIIPKSKGDEDKISQGLSRLHEEDPSFIAHYDPEIKQTIIAGLGELHLEVIIEKLKKKFGVEVNAIKPRIPYRETIRGAADGHHRHKKQTGGHGQFGEVMIKIEPLQPGAGFEFVEAITGGAIPAKFIPPVEKGINETMKRGVLAGYPVIDVKVTLYDGSFHTVDSSDMSFQIAGSMAFQKAFMEAKPILLEPIYLVEVKVPEECMGDIIGDLTGRGGKILGMEAEGHFQVVRAEVPLAKLDAEGVAYSTALRSMTQGRGLHTRRLSHYEQVPHDRSEKVIVEAKKEKEQEA